MRQKEKKPGANRTFSAFLECLEPNHKHQPNNEFHALRNIKSWGLSKGRCTALSMRKSGLNLFLNVQ